MAFSVFQYMEKCPTHVIIIYQVVINRKYHVLIEPYVADNDSYQNLI